MKFVWDRTAKRTYNLRPDMGAVWETLYSEWVAVVKVDCITTRIGVAPSQAAAKQLVERYWLAAAAMVDAARKGERNE